MPPIREGKWIYAIEEQRLLAYERKIACAFSRAVVHTEIERDDFERLIHGVPVCRVCNGVDLDYFRPRSEAKQPATIGFTGVMDYRPNVDAVEWFCGGSSAGRATGNSCGKLHRLRKPAGQRSAETGKTEGGNTYGAGPGHPP